MRLFTSVSDKVFLVTLLLSATILAYIFYSIAEGFSETMLMEKKNIRIDSLRIEAPLSELALIGTSHADSHAMPSGMHYIRLTGGHNLPPAMYYEAKALLKYPTTVNTVYLEADDHIFMNGPSYNVKKTSGTNLAKNYMYESWQDYFDEEGKEIFGKAEDNQRLTLSLSLQPDVKPILLKRMIQKATKKFRPEPKDSSQEKSTTCEHNTAPKEPEATQETYWSRIQGEKRSLELLSRLGGFSLDKPSPIDPLMAEYYEKTIQLFVENGIKVIFIRFPVSKDFQKGVHPENTSAIRDYTSSLQKKYGIPILDLGYLAKHGDKFFENEDHVHQDFFPLIGQLIINDYCTNRQ
jgi:hypothetical protein